MKRGKVPVSTRRTVLKITAGMGGISLGSTSAFAYSNEIGIKHSDSSTSRTSANEGDFDRAVSHKLNIVPEDADYITFGGDAGRKLRITDVDTGDQVTLDPETDTETVNASRLRPEPDDEPDENGIVSTTVTASGLEEQDDSVEIEVEVSGDTDPFPDGIFGRFEVELLDESDNVISSTDERIVGTGYQYNFEQQNSTVQITRDPEVDESWETAFAVAESGVFIFSSPDDIISIDNNEGDDEFDIDLSELDVPDGEYEWELVIATPGTDLEDMSSLNRSDIIVTLNDTFLDPVVIEGDEDETESVEIEDWHDLNAIRENLHGDHELVADLDEATAGYDEHVANPQAGFDPIGNEENPFTGSFNGNGNDISGLQIDLPNDDQVGLFGHIRRGAVTDVTLSEVDVTGGSSVGGLVGFNTAPETEEDPHGITNVDVSGSVSGTNRVGGIVGLNRMSAEITDSTAACEVVADGDNVGGLIGTHNGEIISESAATGSVDGEFNTGGFVGVNFNKIEDCHATGDVEGETTGGFAAGNDSGAEITRSYATGDVTSNRRAGGFAGGNAGGTITESFAVGTVSGGENVGGFISRNGNEFAEEDGFRAEIKDCYAVGDVTGDERIGGFVGHNFFGDVEQSYAASDVSGNESIGGFVGVNRDESEVNDAYWDATTAETSDGGTALTTTEMQGESAMEAMSVFDFDETWDIVADPDYYPILSWQDEDEVELPDEEEVTGDTTITLDNVGSSAWQVTNIAGDGVEAPLDEDNPKLTLEVGLRYVIENTGWSAHPVEFRDTAGEPLLSQDGSGSFENDSGVDWVENDEKVAFRLTEELATEIDDYICTNHSSMVGDVELSDAEDEQHESGVSQEVFDAVDEEGDGDLSLAELRDAVRQWGENEQVNDVEISLNDLRNLVDYWQQT